MGPKKPKQPKPVPLPPDDVDMIRTPRAQLFRPTERRYRRVAAGVLLLFAMAGLTTATIAHIVEPSQNGEIVAFFGELGLAVGAGAFFVFLLAVVAPKSYRRMKHSIAGALKRESLRTVTLVDVSESANKYMKRFKSVSIVVGDLNVLSGILDALEDFQGTPTAFDYFIHVRQNPDASFLERYGRKSVVGSWEIKRTLNTTEISAIPSKGWQTKANDALRPLGKVPANFDGILVQGIIDTELDFIGFSRAIHHMRIEQVTFVYSKTENAIVWDEPGEFAGKFRSLLNYAESLSSTTPTIELRGKPSDEELAEASEGLERLDHYCLTGVTGGVSMKPRLDDPVREEEDGAV